MKINEGGILSIYNAIIDKEIEPKDKSVLDSTIQAVRYLVNAAKAYSDIKHNISSINSTTNDYLTAFYERQLEICKLFVEQFDNLNNGNDNAISLEDLHKMYEVENAEILVGLKKNQFTDLETSTLLNVNRELYVGRKALLSAKKKILVQKP